MSFLEKSASLKQYGLASQQPGDQGIGKSTLLSILGGQWYSTLGIVDNDKDSVEYMRGCWILEVEEMVCAKKTEVDHLKAFISRRVDQSA